MRKNVEIRELIVRANNRSDCAHGCRYCPISRKRSVVELERYANFIERVQAWIAQNNSAWSLYHALGYHDNYNEADLDVMRRLNGNPAISGITLGGLPSRTVAELHDWLALLKTYGLETVHATFGGAGSTHDRWNNKQGNFDLLMRTLQAAGELDLALGQRLLVSRSTLPDLDFLLDGLETFPRHEGNWRYAMPFYYQSIWQKAQPDVEEDRIDESIRDRLPARILALRIEPDADLFVSEREWIRAIQDGEDPVDQATAVIHITKNNIEYLETTAVADIIADLEAEIRAAYEVMPMRHELCDRYGDKSGTKIYPLARCLEMKWLDMYRAEHPAVQFDQSLTHCWFGA